MPRRVSNSIRTQLKRWTATTSNLTKQSLGKSARSQLFRASCPTRPHLRNLPSRRSNRQSRDAYSHTPAARQRSAGFLCGLEFEEIELQRLWSDCLSWYI